MATEAGHMGYKLNRDNPIAPEGYKGGEWLINKMAKKAFFIIVMRPIGH